ncbi:MAG: dihydropteridine reductase [Clostridia bacterium]|nr:dihydropteridine reductase [Clostridia bacterium]
MQNQNTIVANIRNQYTERKIGKVEALVALDEKVKRPANIFAYVFGTVGALVLGTGMCLAMKVLTIPYGMLIGIGVGLVGIAMVSVNYFIYKAILKRGKKKHGEEILRLSNEILGE